MKINLSRNAWHRKLQGYVLGVSKDRYEDMPNLCPYFWLTVFSLLLAPFFFLWKGIVLNVVRVVLVCVVVFFRGLDKVIDAVVYPIKTYICKPLDKLWAEQTIKKMSPEDVLYFRKGYLRGKKRPTAIFERWKETAGETWANLLREYEKDAEKRETERLKAKYERDRKHYEAREVAEESRKKKLLKIAALTQKAAPFILIALAVPVVYFAFLLVSSIYNVLSQISIDWELVWNSLRIAGYWVGIVLAGIISLAVLLLTLYTLFTKLFSKCWLLFCVPFKSRALRATGRGLLHYVLIPVGNGLEAFFIGFGSVLELLCEYVKATKEGYCPKVDWKD